LRNAADPSGAELRAIYAVEREQLGKPYDEAKAQLAETLKHQDSAGAAAVHHDLLVADQAGLDKSGLQNKARKALSRRESALAFQCNVSSASFRGTSRL
jgi:hypothetical protein